MFKVDKSKLTIEQKKIFLEEGTESPGSSPLNYEKREGDYHCVGCGANLFESKTNINIRPDRRVVVYM